jgi:hypothetical protein
MEDEGFELQRNAVGEVFRSERKGDFGFWILDFGWERVERGFSNSSASFKIQNSASNIAQRAPPAEEGEVGRIWLGPPTFPPYGGAGGRRMRRGRTASVFARLRREVSAGNAGRKSDLGLNDLNHPFERLTQGGIIMADFVEISTGIVLSPELIGEAVRKILKFGKARV